MEATKNTNQSSKRFVAVLVTLFFLSTSIPAFLKPVFTAPDESVNYAAVKAFRHTGSFDLGQAALGDEAGVVKPRSAQVIDGRLVPLSYLGFPLVLGLVGTIAGELGSRLVVPLVAAFALVAFYILVSDFFDQRRARLALLLAASFPSVLFFTFKGMWHNMFFTSLLMLAIFALRKASRSTSWWASGLAGLLAGLAMMIRPNEAVWAAPLFLVLALISRYRINKRKIALAFAGGIVALIPMLTLNAATYGQPFSFGYTLAIERQTAVDQTSSLSASVRRLFLPARPSLEHYRTATQWYAVELTPFHFLFFMLGLAGLWIARDRNAWRWFAVAAASTFWLFVYYFGTIYSGYPSNVVEPSIASSYLRYLLPATFLLAPVIATGIVAIGTKVRLASSQSISVWLLATIVVGSALAVTAFNRDSGLIKYFRRDYPEALEAQRAVSRLTPENAVIIAGRKDKLFFPARGLVMGYNDVGASQLEVLPRLLEQYPVYYNDASGRDAPTWSVEAQRYGYALQEVGVIGADPLYQFIKQDIRE
jgi:hypothetical protein